MRRIEAAPALLLLLLLLGSCAPARPYLEPAAPPASLRPVPFSLEAVGGGRRVHGLTIAFPGEVQRAAWNPDSSALLALYVPDSPRGRGGDTGPQLVRVDTRTGAALACDAGAMQPLPSPPGTLALSFRARPRVYNGNWLMAPAWPGVLLARAEGPALLALGIRRLERLGPSGAAALWRRRGTPVGGFIEM